LGANFRASISTLTPANTMAEVASDDEDRATSCLLLATRKVKFGVPNRIIITQLIDMLG
jgi:hypothetical protein